MKINPINNSYNNANKTLLNRKKTNFKGKYTEITSCSNGNSVGYWTITPNNKYEFLDYSRSDIDSGKWKKNNSKIEQTIGTFHEHMKRKAYFADPKEIVNDNIREEVDFIFYDPEPIYPNINDIEKNYFGQQCHNYGQDFANVRDFNYRYEMSTKEKLDRLGNNNSAEADNLKKEIDIAKYHQWQSNECLNIYKQGDLLRLEKEYLENEVARKQKYIDAANNDINDGPKLIELYTKKKAAIQEIYNQEKVIFDALVNVPKLKLEIDELVENDKILFDNNSKYRDQSNIPILTKDFGDSTYRAEYGHSIFKPNIKNLDEFGKQNEWNIHLINLDLKNYKNAIEQCDKNIAFAKLHFSELPDKIKQLQTDIAEYNIKISEIKTKLKPLFEELKNFYIKQKIMPI